MKLQILVPHYDEPMETVLPLLESLALQQNVDFCEVGVIICHDGEDISYFFPARYPFNINEIRIPHKGVSAARNAALDAATADYVMFCDCDDMFFSSIGLWQVFREMGKGFDVLISEFLEETRTSDTKEPIYIPRERNAVCVHGKVFRREFLVKNNIRWDEALTIHEDSYFNILAQSVAKDVKYTQNAFYLWKWRDDSVCRRPENHTIKTYDKLIESNDRLVRELERRGMKDKAAYHTAGLIVDAFYTFNVPQWGEQETHYRDNAERRFLQYAADHGDVFSHVDDSTLMHISLDVLERFALWKTLPRDFHIAQPKEIRKWFTDQRWNA